MTFILCHSWWLKYFSQSRQCWLPSHRLLEWEQLLWIRQGEIFRPSGRHVLGSSSFNRVNSTNEKDLVGWSSANKGEQERDYWQCGGTGTQAINRSGNEIWEARRTGWSFSRPDLAHLALLTPSVGARAVNMPAGKAERIEWSTGILI